MTATITSRDGMQQALEQLARLYEGLADLRRDVEPLNPRNFAILAEGHLDQIRGLQRELDTYALSRHGKKRIDETLDRLPEQRVETYSGDLREIDLDKRSFVLRDLESHSGELFQVECQFLPELLEAAKDALDKRVRVTGSRHAGEARRARPLLVSRLEILDER